MAYERCVHWIAKELNTWMSKWQRDAYDKERCIICWNMHVGKYTDDDDDDAFPHYHITIHMYHMRCVQHTHT